MSTNLLTGEIPNSFRYARSLKRLYARLFWMNSVCCYVRGKVLLTALILKQVVVVQLFDGRRSFLLHIFWNDRPVMVFLETLLVKCCLTVFCLNHPETFPEIG